MRAKVAQTVFVVDDDEAVRDAVGLLLETKGLACETYANAAAFVAALEARIADAPASLEGGGCLVLDVRMPGASGLDLQDELSRRGIDLPIIFVTGYGDVPSAVRAMKGGALDFLSKPFDTDELLARIREALRVDAERRQANRRLASIRAKTATLSPRERDVFERVAAGHANKVVAMDLGVSERTVEIHRSRVMRKMQAHGVADLVRMKLALDQADGSGA